MLASDKPVEGKNPLPIKVMTGGALFRDAFETFVAGDRWSLVSQGAGDIVQIDGNTASASYLDISKDPFAADTETVIETLATFDIPFRVGVGLSLSQRAAGQEFALSAVSTDSPTATYTPRAISSISQTTTTLSVTTASAHGLVPGDRICIAGVSDSRFNYSQLVVATIPTPTTFTATAGPNGTIASVTAGPFSGGTVTKRPALNYARDGSSMVFEGGSATSAAFYVRSEGGDSIPSGTIIGNQTVTIGSTASVQLVNSVSAYAFGPTTQTELFIQQDAVTWTDIGIDSSSAQFTVRHKRTQVVPNPAKEYKLRLRAANLPSFSEAVAKIVSSTKVGSTTATVVTDVPHGLTTGDYVVIYGNRDQTNFANLTTATAVASVVNATTFTIAYGASFTGATYGGYVAKVNGGLAVPGIVTMAAQSVSRTANLVTIVGNAAWSGIVIGDYVNIHGMRVDLTGADLGLDGSYRVRDIATTTLVLEPISTNGGNGPTGTDIASTNVGGAIIKRSCLRVHFVRVSEEAVPGLARNDLALSQPVFMTNTPAVAQSGAPWSMQGNSADDGTTVPNSISIGGRGRNANPTANSATGRLVSALMTMIGALVNKPYSIPELDWFYTNSITTTTDTAMQAALASNKRYLTALQLQNTGAAATTVTVKNGATAVWTVTLPASMTTPVDFVFPTPLQTAVNAALNIACGTATTLVVNAQGYTAP